MLEAAVSGKIDHFQLEAGLILFLEYFDHLEAVLDKVAGNCVVLEIAVEACFGFPLEQPDFSKAVLDTVVED